MEVRIADYQEVAHAGAELAVVIGMFEASMDQNDWPEEIKENFSEKVDELVENMHSELQEFLAFAEAYEEGGEDSEDP